MWSVIWEKSINFHGNMKEKTLSKENFSWVSNLSLSLNCEETFSRLKQEAVVVMLDTLKAQYAQVEGIHEWKEEQTPDSAVLEENKTTDNATNCQFMWCKYSQCGQFHTTNMTSLIRVRRRCAPLALATGLSQLQLTVNCRVVCKDLWSEWAYK